MNNAGAVKNFMQAKADIDVMLKRLTELSANHFGADPDTINWGSVGNLAFYAEKLKEITDSAFQEGEYSKG